jgi:hypothetical protein
MKVMAQYQATKSLRILLNESESSIPSKNWQVEGDGDKTIRKARGDASTVQQDKDCAT